jgi:AmmeMemoRadiSam system protein B
VAASAFARLAGRAIERVILVGPAHRVYVKGLVSPGAARLGTPLGELEVDVAALERVPEILAHPAAHAREHSLEVMLPFLQRVAPHAKVVPVVASHAAPEAIGRVLDTLWGGPETLILISSDLSHFHDYAKARRIDQKTADRICALDTAISPEEACGSVGINGLTWLAPRRGLSLELVDLRNSGDTAGGKDEVVGYGAFAAYERMGAAV